MLFLTGAFFLAGTSVITARFLSGKLGIFTISAVSLFFASAALLPFRLKSMCATLKSFRARDYLLVFFQAVFGIFLFRMFLLLGVARTSAFEAGLLTGATPAVTVLLARLILKERLNPFKLAGLAGTCLGIVLLQADLSKGVLFSWQHIAGNLLVLCAAVCESVFNVFSRKESVRRAEAGSHDTNPLDRTAFVTVIAFFLCLIPACFAESAAGLDTLPLECWLALLWYGLMATVAAFICWYAGISRCDAGTAAAFSGLMPLTSFVLSVILLREIAGFSQWIGGLLVILGILSISRQGKNAINNAELRIEN